MKVIFFDAAGTLIHVAEKVGVVYARYAESHGLDCDADELDAAFYGQYRVMRPLGEDERSWWRELVERTFVQCDNVCPEALFDELYQHYARPEAWVVFPDVLNTLQSLHGRVALWVLSNFDERLRPVLVGLDLMPFFEGLVISAEVGFSKPDRRIFDCAVKMVGCVASECLHVGDEQRADFEGAIGAGMQAFLVRRPDCGLEDLLAKVPFPPF